MTLAEHSFGLMCESMRMEEQAVEEVLGLKMAAIDGSRCIGQTNERGVTTICYDGKPILRMWPPELTEERLPDKFVMRLTRRWCKL